MADTDRPSREHTTAPITPTNTGVVIGILVVLLIALGVYFFWRGTGVQDEQGNHPRPPADTALKRGT
ncbi:MAG TPA: hypothetical protein VJ672_14800 [Gemmatimonadaceae bacterium]|nr:hypothetical protein [Gemmatimonadaceae bacterium]